MPIWQVTNRHLLNWQLLNRHVLNWHLLNRHPLKRRSYQEFSGQVPYIRAKPSKTNVQEPMINPRRTRLKVPARPVASVIIFPPRPISFLIELSLRSSARD